MRLLLDTQAAYWFLAGNSKMPARIRSLIEDQSSEVHFSIISVYEIGLKVQRGRLVDEAARRFTQGLFSAAFIPIALTLEHMEQGAALNWRHGDPWDRLMAAQAIHDDLTLVSIDQKFDELSLKRLW